MLLPKKNVGPRPFPQNYSSLILFRHGNLTFFAESPPTCPSKRAQPKYVLIFSFFLLLLCFFFGGYYVVSMWDGRLWKHFPPPKKKKKKRKPSWGINIVYLGVFGAFSEITIPDFRKDILKVLNTCCMPLTTPSKTSCLRESGESVHTICVLRFQNFSW